VKVSDEVKFEEAIDKEFEDLMIDNPKSLNHIKILNANKESTSPQALALLD